MHTVIVIKSNYYAIAYDDIYSASSLFLNLNFNGHHQDFLLHNANKEAFRSEQNILFELPVCAIDYDQRFLPGK